MGNVVQSSSADAGWLRRQSRHCFWQAAICGTTTSAATPTTPKRGRSAIASTAARVVGMSMTRARHALSSKITTEGRNRINTNARRLPSPRMDGHKFLGGRYFHDLGRGCAPSRSGVRVISSLGSGCRWHSPGPSRCPLAPTGRADSRPLARDLRIAIRRGFARHPVDGRDCRLGHQAEHGRADDTALSKTTAGVDGPRRIAALGWLFWRPQIGAEVTRTSAG
jgi:hypothetical protein